MKIKKDKDPRPNYRLAPSVLIREPSQLKIRSFVPELFTSWCLGVLVSWCRTLVPLKDEFDSYAKLLIFKCP